MIETVLESLAVLRGWSVCALRFFNVVGAHPEAVIGETKKSNLFPIIGAVARGELPELTVCGSDYNTRDGSCLRDYTHVWDITKAHNLVL
mmetsp:Transcript_181/g.57  ORF Transcript_181/g.57 Transcript_181/m.57 type:complete len:90 (+) Transcript_181:383-652(+)